MSRAIADASADSSTANVESPPLESRLSEIGKHREAYDHYQLTGDFDAAEKLIKKPDVTAESSTATAETPGAEASDEAETETASAPGETQQEQPKSRQDRNWAQTRKELAESRRREAVLQAKLELLGERTASGKSAPAADEETASSAAPEPPDFPDINDFDDPKAFAAKVKEWRRLDAAYTRSLIEQAVNTGIGSVELTKQRKASGEDWQRQRDAVKAESKDPKFDATIDGLNVSLTAGKLIFDRKDGAKLAYHLGKNPELAAKLIERTDITGNYQNITELMNAAKKDPELAIEVGRKLALAEVELDRIAESLSKKTVPTKETLARQPKPTSEVAVEPKGSAVEDEEAEAINAGDFTRYKKIADRKAIDTFRNG